MRACAVALMALAASPAAGMDTRGNLEEEICLAEAIYHEARGESIDGQHAVAEVALARVRSSRWPGTLCEAIYQDAQFSFVVDGVAPPMNDAEARNTALRIARFTIMVYNLPKADLDRGFAAGANHYHALYVSPSWAKNMQRTVDIGSHRFYRD